MKPNDDKKIDQIYKAMLRLVEAKGLAGITMSEIAKEANIATGTLYIYFKNKNELINALFTDMQKQVCSSLFQKL